jgi:hypothetical protein
MPATSAETSAPVVSTSETLAVPSPSATVIAATNSEENELARRQREARAKERAKVEGNATTTGAFTGNVQPEAKSAISPPNPNSARTESSPAAGRRVTVQVTYDENGRVTQASGGDATALRIARQKRFPAGKGGSATVTIPIN